MPTSAVLDASVLISAFLTPGPPRRLLDLAERGIFRMVLSPILIEEIRRSLSKPKLVAAYRHTPTAVAAFTDALAAVALVVEGEPGFVSACRDPDDHHVIAAAVTAAATHIVTGDRDLLALGDHAGIRIVPARQFLELLTEP